MDLVLVTAAFVTAITLWQRRRRIQPASVWEKLMVGCGLVTFALFVRLAESMWAEIPWPPISNPLVQQAVVMIGIVGGALAIAAGVSEWIPVLVERGARARWREKWAHTEAALDRNISRALNAKEVIVGLVDAMQSLCDTGDVRYCAMIQRTQEFIRTDAPAYTFSADERLSLGKAAQTGTSMVLRVSTGWLLVVPVRQDRRTYGALLIYRQQRHLCLTETVLLQQTARMAAMALATIVHRARTIQQASLLATATALEHQLGSTDDPATDLMSMMDILHRELGMDYAAALAFEGQGQYARRYSRLWNDPGLSERGIQVAIGHDTLPLCGEATRGQVQCESGVILSPAILPFDDMPNRVVVSLFRGTEPLGILVAASRTKRMGPMAKFLLHRTSVHFASAIERINLRLERNQLSRRLTSLGRIAGHTGEQTVDHDTLTARMLDEIPGTFCQYMRVDRATDSLRIEYRRARRGGFADEVVGHQIAISDIPTCRMVMEAGRSIVFRQDDPERSFETNEASLLFGTVPNSMLLVPVVQKGSCVALLAVGEMREVSRHTYSVSDRRFADSLSRLHKPREQEATYLSHLDSFGDLNLTFSSPLTGIMGSVEILRQKITGEGVHQKYLDVIERNASRIKDTVHHLADLSSTAEAADIR
jgi:hypothetical protein